MLRKSFKPVQSAHTKSSLLLDLQRGAQASHSFLESLSSSPFALLLKQRFVFFSGLAGKHLSGPESVGCTLVIGAKLQRALEYFFCLLGITGIVLVNSPVN